MLKVAIQMLHAVQDYIEPKIDGGLNDCYISHSEMTRQNANVSGSFPAILRASSMWLWLQ